MRRLRKPSSAKGKSSEDLTSATTTPEVLAASASLVDSGHSGASTETHAGVNINVEHNSPTKSSKAGGGTLVTPAKLRSRRNIMDTNGSSSGSLTTLASTSGLGKEIFKHFEKSGKSELYGLFTVPTSLYLSLNLVKKKKILNM